MIFQKCGMCGLRDICRHSANVGSHERIREWDSNVNTRSLYKASHRGSEGKWFMRCHFNFKSCNVYINISKVIFEVRHIHKTIKIISGLLIYHKRISRRVHNSSTETDPAPCVAVLCCTGAHLRWTARHIPILECYHTWQQAKTSTPRQTTKRPAGTQSGSVVWRPRRFGL